MTNRTALPVRTWLDGTLYDLLTLPSVLHYDITAYTDATGVYWVLAEARQSGRTITARGLYRLSPDTLALEARTMAPALTPAHWTDATHGAFKALHPQALAACILLPGYARLSVLCHYVTAPDAEPMPRGAVNRYTYQRGTGRQFEPLPDLL